MADKLGAFLRVLGSGLSPQAFQANVGMYQQEKAEQQQVAQLTIKQTLANLGYLGVAARDANARGDSELSYKVGTAAKEVISQADPKYQKLFNETFLSYATSPSDKKDEVNIHTLMSPDGKKRRSFRKDDPRIDTFMDKGWTVAPSRQETAKPGGFTKKIQSDIDDQILKSKQGLDRLQAIKAGFKPEFTEVGTKASVSFNAFVEKTFGVSLNKASKQQLTEFTTFARNTIGNLNQHIRDRTGAVMNAAEIPRMMGEVPVIGDGIFDGDSATQFKAKLEGLITSLEAAEARLQYVKANGLTPDKARLADSGEWKQISTSGLSLEQFKGLPAKPKQFDQGGWDRMSPNDRKELVNLMNRRKNVR